MDSQVVGEVYGLDTLEALPEVRLHSQRVLCSNNERERERESRDEEESMKTTGSWLWRQFSLSEKRNLS